MTQHEHRRVLVLGLVVGLLVSGSLSGLAFTTGNDTQRVSLLQTTTGLVCHAQLASIAADLDVDAAFPTEMNVSTATNLSAAYENAYMTATNDLPDGIDTTIQDTDTSRADDGYLVRLDAVYGGSYVIEGQPRPPATTADGDTATATPTPATTVVHVDDFYSVYYYVTDTHVIRLGREQRTVVTPSKPPSLVNALTTGDLLGCRRSTTTTTTPTTELEPCQRQPADLNVTVSFPPENLTADTATKLVQTYEPAYKTAHVNPPQRANAGVGVDITNITVLPTGYLIHVEAVYGGTFVITVMPPAPETTTQPSEDRTSRTALTTVGNFDEFYTVYYYVSSTRVIRHEQSTPPATPQTGGVLIACQSPPTTTSG